MGQRITINDIDFTSRWRILDSQWTMRAHMGQSVQSTFVIDDDLGDIDHLNFASRKIIKVFEGASGSERCVYRGRIANKSLGRGGIVVGDAMQWTIYAEDANIDLRGIRVDSSAQGEESDYDRVIDIRDGYLNGSLSGNGNARDSTQVLATYAVNDDLVTLPAETYTDTDPLGVFQRIVEISGKQFFLTINDAGSLLLYYAAHDDEGYLSDISITDDEDAADGVDIFAPYGGRPTGEHEGQSVITGGSVRYGNDSFYEASNLASGETFHDKWEEHFTDQYITGRTSAAALLNNIVGSRVNEQFTYIATIEVPASEVHRIRAGMMVDLRLVSANKPDTGYQRAVQCTYQVVNPTTYEVTIELGKPRGRPLRRNIRPKPLHLPQATTTTGGAITFVTSDQKTGHSITSLDIDALPGVINDDLLLVHVTTDLDSTIPSTPSGFTNIGSGGSGLNMASRGFYRVIDGTESGTYDFVTGNSIIMQVYRGVLTSDPIGAIGGGGTSSATINYPALTLEETGGSSWVAAFAHSKSATDVGTDTVTDLTNRESARSGEHGGRDTGGGVSSWASHNQSVNASNEWQSQVYEIKADTTTTTSGDGHSESIGSGSTVALVNHNHVKLSTSAPTANDDTNDGYRVGHIWLRVNSVATPTSLTAAYVAIDVDAGAAEWEQLGGGVDLSAIDFLVGTASGLLSGEIAVGTTPGGELGGTWASPTVDALHGGGTGTTSHLALGSTSTTAAAGDHTHASSSTHFEVLLTEDGSEPITTEDGLDWLYVEVAN